MTVAHAIYEQGMASLSDDLERIVTVLNEARIPYEVIGGVGVMRRQDLDAAVQAGCAAG